MNKGALKHKTNLFVALVAVILLCVICSGFCIAFADNGDDNSINIVHITDLHYYPTYMSYKQQDPKYDSSAMVDKSKLESKLIVESSMVIKKLFSDILSMDENGETPSRNNSLPDYILVTGDLSSDGERVALIDIANALRDLQNKIRAKGNVNFQIFVIPGNHDIANENATDYTKVQGERIASVNRNDFAKIFAGLGYPNMTDGEAASYYANDEFDNNNLKYLPYDSDKRYVHSENAENIEFAYMAMNDWDSELGIGDLCYTAKCPDGNTFIAIDGLVSGEIGGRVSDGVFEWLNSIKTSSMTDNLISMTHHNVLQHFTMQEKWSKDYLYSNWEEVRDFLVNLGVKYNFSGHMHANDIASYCNDDGYNLYDIETGSPVGYGASYREAKISFKQDGSSDLKPTSRITSDLTHTLRTVRDVDVSVLLDDGYLVKTYTNIYSTNISVDGKINNLSDYINERLYKDMLDNVIDSIIKKVNRENTVDLILGYVENNLGDSGLLDKLFKDNKDSLRTILSNLYNKIQSETLKDFVYTGNKEFLQGEENKLRAYLYNFVSSVIDIETAKNYTIQNLFVDSYTTHLKGGEGVYLPANSKLKESIEWMQSGELVRAIVNKINDKNNGITILIQRILSSNYNLTANLNAEEIRNVNIILAPFGIKLDSVNLDKLIKNVAGNKLDKYPSNIVGDKLTYIVSESIAKGIGSNLSDVIRSLVTDSSYDGVLDVESRVVYAENDEHSHYAGGKKRAPSVVDGRLPSMLTMTFGENVYEDRNLVWFTDKRISATDLQIVEGDRSALYSGGEKVKSFKGESKIYAVDYPLIELGIMTTYTTKEIARHEISVTGLKPNTMYSYRVGDAKNVYWSDVYTFKTSAKVAKKPFEILIATDMQGMTKAVYEDSAKVLRAAQNVTEFGYDFILNLGDMVDDGKNLNQWQYLLDSNKNLFGTIPQVIAPGNHDLSEFEVTKGYIPTDSNVVTDKYTALQLHFNFGGRDKNYYSFDYNGVHFIVLDTNDITENNNLSFNQIEWLTEDLKKNEDNIIVVSMHKGIYSAGIHQNDKEVVGMRKVLSKLFSDYKVELVLQGHDHIYSESFFLDGDGKKTKIPVYKQGAPINNNSGGVLYVTMGSTGDKFYDFNFDTDDFINKGKMFHAPKLKNPTFGRLMFDGQNIKFYSYQYDIANDKIMQLKIFNDNNIMIIISSVTGGLLGIGIITLLVILVLKHKKKVALCKEENKQLDATSEEKKE